MYKSFFEKFHIGAYCLGKSCRDEEHVRELRECGIDLLFSVNDDEDLLDLLAKHGVGAVVNGVLPWWFGADGKNAGTMHLTNPKEAYIERAHRFKDHPAIVGVDVGDEPSSLDFPHYGSVIEALKEHFSDKLLYLNIYPSYGMLASAGKEQAKRELGTDTYAEYLDAYASNVDLPYLSIDHYLYSSGLDAFLSDLSDASALVKKHGKELMIVLQVNSNNPEVFVSAEQLRFQAWCALAFGARSVTWACYSPGWWHNCVLDKNGMKTEQYDKLKTVNLEMRRIADKYMTYAHEKSEIVTGGNAHIDSLGVSVTAECDLLIGQLLDKNGGTAAIVVPLEDGKELKISQSSSPRGALRVHAASDELVLNEQNDCVCTLGVPIFMYYD